MDPIYFVIIVPLLYDQISVAFWKSATKGAGGSVQLLPTTVIWAAGFGEIWSETAHIWLLLIRSSLNQPQTTDKLKVHSSSLPKLIKEPHVDSCI